MNWKIFLICLAVSLSQFVYAQTEPLNVFSELKQRGGEGSRYALFTQKSGPDLMLRTVHEFHASELTYFDLNPDLFRQFHQEKPDQASLEIPFESGQIRLDLYQKDIYADSYTLRSSHGTVAHRQNTIFYRGIVHGNSKSVAVVSISQSEIRVLYTTGEGNYRIQKTQGSQYVGFEDNDRITHEEFTCETDDSAFRHKVRSVNSGQRSVLTGNCVEIYFEVDFESYQDNNSSVEDTEFWVASLFNEVATLYQNEGVPLVISEIFIWTQTDPYASLTSTSSVLNAFVTQIQTNGFNGRLAHFLSTRSLGGGIAYIDVLCSTSVPCAVSASLSTNIVPLPNYSWNVTVVAHELGHNFGSPHTHGCNWNGNNTQIDDCGNVWAANNGYTPQGAACFDDQNPILPAAGTVMSYCHLVSGVGIDLALGFGPLPGALILDAYQTAPCNTGTCAPPVCTMLQNPENNATDVDVNSVLEWNLVQGAEGYLLNLGTTPGGTEILNALDVGLAQSYVPGTLPFNTTLYFSITPYNALGNATGCAEQSFTTESNVPPSCTQLVNPANGASGVDINTNLTWEHAVGNQTGYKLTVGFSPGTGELANALDVGNVITFNPGTLPFETPVYATITPYWAGGDISGCPTESFITEEATSGDLCTDAIPIACGQTLSGNTAEATFDNAPLCFTSNTAPGIWYTFTGDGSVISLSTCNQSGFDTKLSVYSGSCGALSCEIGIDDAFSCSALASKVVFQSQAGVTYFALVHGYGNNTGNYSLTLTCDTPQLNDLCPNATSLSVFALGECPGQSATGSTVGATDDGSQSCNNATFNNGVWYAFNAPSSGSMQVWISSVTGTHFGNIYDQCGGTELFCFDGVQVSEVSGLTPATSYRLLVRSRIGEEGDFSVCLEELALQCTNLLDPVPGSNDNSLNSDISWEVAPAATGYFLTIGTSPGGNEILADMDVGNVTIYDPGILPSNASIYVRIVPYDLSGSATGCIEEVFYTGGALTYCFAEGQNSTYEWIEFFSLGNYSNPSGAAGYSDFTGDTIEVAMGGVYPVQITPGFSGILYDEYFKVWIDYNQDGAFDDPGEEVYAFGPTDQTILTDLAIPLNVGSGYTRMRVVMEYDAFPGACGEFTYGEVEDYTLFVNCNLVVNTYETGPGSLNFALSCIGPGDTITFSNTLQGDTIDFLTTYAIINQDVAIIADQGLEITICGLTTSRVFLIDGASNALLKGLKIIAGMDLSGSAILNYANVRLEDVMILNHPGIPGATLVENLGILEISGATEMKN